MSVRRGGRRMAVAGAIFLAVGLAALGSTVAALAGAVSDSAGGYVCGGIVTVVFGFGGLALLAGSRVMPDDWPPRDDDPPGRDGPGEGSGSGSEP